MPPNKKKGRGSKAKGKAKKKNNDGVQEITDSFSQAASINHAMSMMSQMRERIISSLGDGYDADSLKALDKKLCDYFLEDDDFYYDDGARVKSSNTQEPTPQELDHYSKSIIIRKGVLRKAYNNETIVNYLEGQGHVDLLVYQSFHDDLMTYYYAWFGLIFKQDRSELRTACNIISKFAILKLERIDTSIDEIIKIMSILKELQTLLRDTIKEHDVEAHDDVGIIDHDVYVCDYKASLVLAKAGRKDEAQEYFDEAFTAENVWGYFEDRYCANLMEFATGKQLLENDLVNIDLECTGGGNDFYYDCIQAYLNEQRGTVPLPEFEDDDMDRASSAENCGEACLKLIDRKLCDYYLPFHDFYFDDRVKSEQSQKPTAHEFELLEKSVDGRLEILRRASSMRANSNYSSGCGYRNLEVYRELYDDIMAYYFSWTQFIFKDRKLDLQFAYKVIANFASVRLQMENVSDEEVLGIMRLFSQLRNLFHEPFDPEKILACDELRKLEHEFYECCYYAAVLLACDVGKKEEAENYFTEALGMETSWGYYEDGHCAKVFEFAMGKKLSEDDLEDLLDRYAFSPQFGFYHKCLCAMLTGQGGSVKLINREEEARRVFLESVAEEAGCSVSEIFSMDGMRFDLGEKMISSLGDGYDSEDLKQLDQKLCDCYLEEDDFYYDDNTKEKSTNPQKPTEEEIEHYKKSYIIRIQVLRKADSFEATSNYIGGEGHKNLPMYQHLYDDLKTYHYAWFELIFKGERSHELLSVCKTMSKFASVKLKYAGMTANETLNIMSMLREIKDLYQYTADQNDFDAFEELEYLEQEFYECCYYASVVLARANMNDYAAQYFDEACLHESIYGYEHKHRLCAKVLEFAIGRQFSEDELRDIETSLGDEFYVKCLKAHLDQQKGSVSFTGFQNK